MIDPYGKVTIFAPDGTTVRTASLFGNPWTFTGRRLDQETGLMYFRNRMFDTGLGRFCGRDPIGYEGGLGLYQYAKSSPAVFFDPDGLEPRVTYDWDPKAAKGMPYYLAPGLAESGGAETRTDFTPSCRCDECKAHPDCYWVSCQLQFRAKIVLSKQLPVNQRPGKYGHEQMHVDNCIRFINLLGAGTEPELQKYGCEKNQQKLKKDPCEEFRKKAEDLLQKAWAKFLVAERAHDKEQRKDNPLTTDRPADGQDYPPQDMPDKPERELPQ